MEGLFKTSTGELFEKVSKKRVVVAADWACRGPHLEAVQRDPEGVYGDLLPHLRAADLAIVNVETTLSEKGAPILKGGPNISCPADCVKGLTQVPFHIACLANNHTRDFDDEGLIHTIEILQNAGLATCGAGSNPEEITAPLIWELGEIKLGILNVAEGEACLPSREGRPGVASLDLERIEKQLAQLKETADFTLVVVHAGREHVPAPPPYIQTAYRRMVRAGANMVVAHHPHVLQGIEIYRGAPIVYSMGNFLFWMGSENPYHRKGFLVEFELAGSLLTELKVIPYGIYPEGLSLLKGAEKSRFFEELKLLSGLLPDPENTQELWAAFADVFYERLGEKALVLDYSTPLAAARSKNYFITPAHRELMITMMNRIHYQELGTSESWAKELVRKWMGLDK
mgnify:CR=1 FL=1|jgi:poly-gamma-glutamate synthesis protein (capsule biosynthesis protein)